ncbi:hypothetical protein [Kribbella deserti]|uniref:Transposase n=1 Tax=Kribbella deserti TaxID=1926257 RepID=A0ABV6QIP2_9ACTN
MDFDEAATELYGVPAADFISKRNELAKQLKADGDAAGSARLKALRKPTVAAWVANLVAREKPDELDDLLALGDELREATADLDGERLRELTPRRHQQIDVLAKAAQKLAADAGIKISADVGQKLRETLDAALIDPAAGEALRDARLSSALRHVGFGVVDESGEPSNVMPLTDDRRRRADERRKKRSQAGRAAEEAPESESSGSSETAAEARKRAEREEAERLEAEQREAERLEAQREADEAVAAAEAAESTVEDLTTDLAEARERLEAAQEEVRRLGDALDEARKEARAAQQTSRDARKRLNRLGRATRSES